jgi:hypothetical protein
MFRGSRTFGFGSFWDGQRPLTADRTPTLLDYARVVEWMVEHRDYGEADMPKDLQALYKDALDRAALGRFAKSLERLEKAGE